MEMLVAIFILLLAGTVGIVSFLSSRGKNKDIFSAGDFSQKSPYEKYIAERNTGWELGLQRKLLAKRKISLKDALTRGDRVAEKVQRSMVVFSRSLVSYLQNKLKG